ncbi:MAG: type II toxin-antitoxin system HicA family toxin [Chloroflexi bacterium]|nr:type II toxin-antitoxin system HicA family toxin [Chloroflexota bacterium]
MSLWRPCKRREFVRRLGKLGFDGPFSGARHQFMIYGQYRLSIPTNVEYSVPQVRVLLREVADILGRRISAGEWESLG